MREIGDYVLVKSIQPHGCFSRENAQLPRWARLTDVKRDGYPYSAKFIQEFEGYHGSWGFDESDLVPEYSITDEQWAQLAMERLTNA